MTIWYSRKPIGPGAGSKFGSYFVYSADQIHELESLWQWLLPQKGWLSSREQCEEGINALGRKTGRPVIKIHSSLEKTVINKFSAVEIPDGYLQIVITLLRREYIAKDPKIDVTTNSHVLKYMRIHIGYSVRELNLGRPTGQGERESSDAIRDPEIFLDSDEEDPEELSRIRWRIAQIGILNSRIANLDFGQRSKWTLTEEPTDRMKNSHKRVKARPKPKTVIKDEEISSTGVKRDFSSFLRSKIDSKYSDNPELSETNSLGPSES